MAFSNAQVIFFGIIVSLGGIIVTVILKERSFHSYSAATGKIVLSEEFLSKPTYPIIIHWLNYLGSGFAEWYAPLEKDQLLSEAIQRSEGLDVFWKEHEAYWNQGLDALLYSLKHEAKGLTTLGRLAAREQIITSLLMQLNLQHIVTAHSDILQENVRPPVVVTGIPRSGQTFLHNLLCQNPSMNCVRYHEALFPIVPNEIGINLVDSDRDPRIMKTKQGLNLLHWLRPLYRHMHEFGPLVPFDEHQLGSYIFASTLYLNSYLNMKTYNEWWEGTDHIPMYQFIRRCFQVLQWQDFSPLAKRKVGTWVLKSQQNIEQMDTIWKVFPGSHFIVTHRDALMAVRSHLNLVTYTAGTLNDGIDVHELGRFWLRKINRFLKRMKLSTVEIPPENMHHVNFETMTQNASSALREIFGEDFNSQNDTSCTFNLSSDKASAYKDEFFFEYSLEPFNITEEEVTELDQHFERNGLPF